jgi:hypothetical protein
MNKTPKTLFKIAFIIVCSIAMTACTTSDKDKLGASETAQVEQTTSLSSTVTATPTPSATPIDSKVVTENEAFRIIEPAPNAEVGTTFTVKGQARVFEGVFSYSFEDGHKVLAEGNVHAAAGAPEWADFEFTVTYEKPTNPVGVLIISEKSAKDGSSINQIMIPLKFNPDNIEPVK